MGYGLVDNDTGKIHAFARVGVGVMGNYHTSPKMLGNHHGLRARIAATILLDVGLSCCLCDRISIPKSPQALLPAPPRTIVLQRPLAELSNIPMLFQ